MSIGFQLLAVFLGGAIGSILRYATYLWCASWGATGFPWGTLMVNSVGCFLAGILIGSGLTEQSPALRTSVGVGFLGGLTTFSTFSVETVQHLRDDQWGIAALSVSANLVLGVFLVLVGAMISKKVLG